MGKHKLDNDSLLSLKIAGKMLLSVWLLIAVAWMPVSHAASMIQITKVRISHNTQKTRLVFDLSGPFDHQVTHLFNPERLVIDLTNTQLPTLISKVNFNNTPITDFKITLNNNRRDSRITFLLLPNTSAKTFTLTPSGHYSYRLVIDLYPINNEQAIKTNAVMKANEMPILPPVVVTAKLTNNPVNKKINKATKVAVTPIQSSINDKTNRSASKPKSASSPLTTTVVAAAPQPTVVLPTSSTVRPIVVVIDPGHGGKDPGATGPQGYKEKNVVLAIARDLQTLLNKEPGFRAVLTRNGDYFIPLRQRLDIARSNKGDMFVAIHADAYRNADAMGASVFALSERGATSEAARWLAEKENYSELIGGGDLPDKDNLLRSVLIDLSQTHTISVSLQIGSAVLRQLSYVTHLHYTRVEQAAFVVLKSPDIPSILVETGYISNPRQEQQLINPQYQQQIAYALMQGIKSYFMRNPPRGTMLSAKQPMGMPYR